MAWRNAPDAQFTKVLDAFGGSPLYSGRVNTAEVGPNVPKVSSTSAGNYLYGLDNPGSPIVFRGDAKTPLTFARSDRFTVTVTDNPDPNATMDNGGGAPASIWIPVGTFDWWWGAAAAYNTTSKTYTNAWDPTRGATPYGETTYFPTWMSNIRAPDSTWKQLQ